MTADPPGDRPPHTDQGVEPQGKAALLLVESLIHILVQRGVISLSDAVEVADVAADVASDHDCPTHGQPATEGYLRAIASNLRSNLSSQTGKANEPH